MRAAAAGPGQRAVSPAAVTRTEVMDVAHVASAVVPMASLPLDANVLFLTIMATQMTSIGRG